MAKSEQVIKPKQNLIDVDLSEVRLELKKESNEVNKTIEKKFKFRLIVSNPFGKYKTKGQIILKDEEIQFVIDSGNLKNCLKSSV